MSPERAWEILMFEANIHPHSVPNYVPELIADASYWRAKELVKDGVYPEYFDGPEGETVSDREP